MLRLLGVPRMAATSLAKAMGGISNQPLSQVRNRLKHMDETHWIKALGDQQGQVYHKVWRVLER